MRILIAIMIIFLCFPTKAEKPTEAWVMCQPKSEVIVRARPNKHADEIGRVFPGDHIELDGKKVGRWYHCYVMFEATDGWIRGDHLSFTEPDIYEDGKKFVTTRKKLVTRYSIKGNVFRKFKKAGVEVTVFMMADEWSVTSQGYIMTKYLEAVDE